MKTFCVTSYSCSAWTLNLLVQKGCVESRTVGRCCSSYHYTRSMWIKTLILHSFMKYVLYGFLKSPNEVSLISTRDDRSWTMFPLFCVWQLWNFRRKWTVWYPKWDYDRTIKRPCIWYLDIIKKVGIAGLVENGQWKGKAKANAKYSKMFENIRRARRGIIFMPCIKKFLKVCYCSQSSFCPEAFLSYKLKVVPKINHKRMSVLWHSLTHSATFVWDYSSSWITALQITYYWGRSILASAENMFYETSFQFQIIAMKNETFQSHSMKQSSN